MNVQRRHISRIALVAGPLLALSLLRGGVSAGVAAPASLLAAPASLLTVPASLLAAPASLFDAPDWPMAIATGADGSVWLALGTDTATGGVARFDANLELGHSWALASAPAAVAAANGAVHVDEDTHQRGLAFDVISRFTSSGQHVRTWDARMFVLDLDPSADGNLFALGSTDAGGASCRVTVFDSSGQELDGWAAPDYSVALTIGPSGDVYVGQSMALFGSLWRYKPDGTQVSRQSMTSIPVALDFGPDGLLYVASHFTTSRDRVTIHDEVGSYLKGWPVEARLEDLAVGPDGSVYVIVWLEADRRFEVRKYDPQGNLLVRLVDMPRLPGTPPPTATPGGSPGPSATATEIPPSATPTATATPTPAPTKVAPTGLYLPLALANANLATPPTATATTTAR